MPEQPLAEVWGRGGRWIWTRHPGEPGAHDRVESRSPDRAGETAQLPVRHSRLMKSQPQPLD